jgi:hypothetical protein
VHIIKTSRCRTGTWGNTWSTRCATVSAMRRVLQEGQIPRLCGAPHNGCYAYSRQEARVPVVHWVEILVWQAWAKLSGGDGSPWAGGSA